MKITIDTSSDSHDDIREVIRMLQSIVGNVTSNVNTSYDYTRSAAVEKQAPRDMFASDSPAVPMMGMFDSSPSTPSSYEPTEQNYEQPVAQPSEYSATAYSTPAESRPTGFNEINEQLRQPESTQPSMFNMFDTPVQPQQEQRDAMDLDSKDDDDDMFSFDLETY